MHIEPFFDERTSTLTYVVFDPETRDAVVIDPVLDYEPIGSKIWTESADVVDAYVKKHNLTVHYILETHAHADHISGAAYLKDRLDGAQVMIGRDITKVQKIFKAVFNLPAGFATDGSQFDALVTPGEPFYAGSVKIESIATPGHTPACLTYKIGDAIFTGDALLMPDVGTGRCDFPAGSSDDMYTSVHDVLYAMPDATRVFVGHDYPDGRDVAWVTTIADQKANNRALPFDRSREDYVAWRDKRDASLRAPRLLFQSVQVNIDAGNLPAAEANERQYLKIPLNVFRPEPAADAELVLEPTKEIA